MFRPLVIILIAASVTAAAVAQNGTPTPAKETEHDGVTRATLANGLRVVIVRDPLAPVVTIEENYLVGANETPPGFPGMAHAQEHMAFRGCADVSADQIAAIYAQLGGYDNADTQQTITQYFTTIPAADLEIALRIDAACMRDVMDSNTEWQQEKGAIEQEVARDLSEPTYKFITRLNEDMFAGTPYAHDALGSRESFEKTTGAMLKAFYQRWYAPNNAVLVIAGDVDPEATLATVKRLYEAIPRRPIGKRPLVNLGPVKQDSFTLDSNLPYTLAFVAYRLPGTESADYAAARVMADVLASQRGDLYALVPAGKALYANFDLAETFPKASVGFSVAALPAATAPDAVVRDMRSIVANYVRQGFPAELVEAAKRQEIASALFRRNSISDLASVWSQALAAEGRNSPDENVDAIRRVTAADVNRVASELLPLTKAAKKPWKLDELADGIIEFVAALPVYRTYIDDRSAVSEADRAAIEAAAKRSHPDASVASVGPALPQSPDVIDFIRDTLLSGDKKALPFARRLQQLSGPAAAKGVEDTALYVYVPVTSRGEVGGDPDQSIGDALQRFHHANAQRAERWPLSIVATNTHDTKRSADVRARLDALSAMPHEWERAVRRWRKLNGKHRRVVKGRLAPDTNTEYLMYQIILALWPPPRAGRRSDDLPDRAWRDSVRERLTAYALKAAREAKTRTSWVAPDGEYERALTDFVSAILEPGEDAPYLPDVARLVSRVASLGARNSLARVAIHLTAPGTPDLYQGDELWNFSLVDPDNRRPVDYDGRSSALQELGDFEARLAGGPIDLHEARLKLWLTQRLLCLRRGQAELFRRGDYHRLTASGPRAGHIVAFARTFEEHQSITIVSRLMPGMKREQEPDWWRDTVVHLPQEMSVTQPRSALLPIELRAEGDAVAAAQLFAKLPVVVLVS